MTTTPSNLTPGSTSGPKRRKKKPLTAHQRAWVAALIVLPLAMIGYKSSSLPGAAELARWFSLEGMPHAMLARTHHLLFTPLGALIVVLFRLGLGIRVLGPFRSILLAIAFQITGIFLGILFFTLVICVVVGLRPVYKRLSMPYFGRSSAMLATVAGTIVLAMLIGALLGLPEIERLGYFPVVVLTLAGDAFSTTLRREGSKSALWRGAATAVAAVVITLIASTPSLQRALVRYPETEMWFLAAIILTSRHLALRLFQHLNPPPKKKKKSKSNAAKVVPAATPIHPDAIASEVQGDTGSEPKIGSLPLPELAVESSSRS